MKRDYEDLEVKEDQGEKDGLYKRLHVSMDRLLRILTTHSTAVDSLERKLIEIESSKKKRQENSASARHLQVGKKAGED